MSWVGGVARSSWNFLENLVSDDGEDPDVTLAKLFEDAEDDEDPYAELARTDQVLHFFEYEVQKHEGYIKDEGAGFSETLENKRQKYYNMVNSIELQEQRITFLVSELLRLRKEFRAQGPERPTPARRKEILGEVEQVKLDIGDSKNKRFFKNKERKEIHAELSPMISQVQTARLLAENSFENAKATLTETSESNLVTETSHHTTTARKRGGGGRQLQRYSDEELKRILKDD
eukprot:TRINITY_DN94063_c0_g1_i1.p1 TRINITY_DN94063_c0_g1~~TRINITY_DN94063_c0_g1_i1.p1  ORF type:complete len:232 (+),score=61.36 TRINITY_DN94063_c0_g1_i1:38-733(+)